MTNTENTKVTKRECLENIIALISTTNVSFENPNITNQVLIDFCEHEIELLDNKAKAAAERAAAKRAEGDALRAQIVDLLTDEPKTKEEITEAIGDEDVTCPMVVARLNQAIKANLAQKTSMEGKNGKKVTGYFRA